MNAKTLALSLLVALAGCGPSFENEAVELEYLESLSNPTPEQFLRRKGLRAAVVRAAEERSARLAEAVRVRAAEEDRRRNTPEAKAEAEAIAAEQERNAKKAAEREEADRRREDQAADALDTDYRAAVAEGLTSESARAVYRSIVDRYPGTRAAEIAQGRLDELDSPGFP